MLRLTVAERARVAKRRRARRGPVRSGDPLLRQAQLETHVRYDPEKQALAELLHEARSDLRTGLAQEAGAADGIKAAVSAAEPEIRRVYASAHGDLREADAQLRGDLSTLSASADPYRAVAAREAAQARGRLDTAFAAAHTELQDRKVGAEAGRAYAVRNQIAQYQGTAQKIGGQRKALAGQSGTFTVATLNDLRAAAGEADFKERQLQQAGDLGRARVGVQRRGQDLTRRGQDLGHQDRQAANQIARQRAARGGGKSGFRAGALTKHQKIVSDIQDAASVAARLKKNGSGSDAIVELMSLPRSKDNPYGGFGPYTTRAAVSLTFNGYIKPHLVSGLRSRGLLVHRTPKRWTTRHRGSVGRQGPTGRQLRTLNPW